MKTASAKAKARRLQQWVRDRIRNHFGELDDDDVRSASMGAQGVDVPLSPLAQALFPFAMECKNTERLSVWKAIEQAEYHAEGTDLMPLVVFKRNRSDVYAILKFDHLLEAHRGE